VRLEDRPATLELAEREVCLALDMFDTWHLGEVHAYMNGHWQRLDVCKHKRASGAKGAPQTLLRKLLLSTPCIKVKKLDLSIVVGR
jgi:hypothetical protein